MTQLPVMISDAVLGVFETVLTVFITRFVGTSEAYAALIIDAYTSFNNQ